VGGRGIAPRIQNLGIRWRWVVSCTPRPHYPRQISCGTQWIGRLMAPEPVWI